MLLERHDAEPGDDAPNLHLGVVAARCDVLAVGRVREAAEAVEPALLLEDERLRLPLPDDELAAGPAGEGEPVARRVERGGGERRGGDVERVDEVRLGHLVEEEVAGRVARHEHLGARVVGGRGQQRRRDLKWKKDSK